MENKIFALVLVSVLFISGCSDEKRSGKDANQGNTGNTKQKIMGEGKKPIPKFTDKNNLE